MAYSDADFIRDYNAALPGSFSLTGVQEGIVKFGQGPLLISAGPGSGKTECLVARALYLILVGGIDPKAILMTTFTRKAARGLKDRLNERLDILQKMNPENQTIQDATIQGMRIGTIHSLAEEILADGRSTKFNGMMIVDEIPLKMLLQNQSYQMGGGQYGPFARNTSDLRVYCDETFGGSRDPAARLIQLYHHLIEDQIDMKELDGAGGEPLIKSYEAYRKLMLDDKRLDFALLLELFLSELNAGALDSVVDQFEYVLVDEYQDTNPIQEDIFFGLAGKKNLCVVGDDDQALYRFRGASVECMVNFVDECNNRWGAKAAKMNLVDNFRSHPRIVDFYEQYMNSHPTLNQAHTRLRVNGNPPLGREGKVIAEHPALVLCQRADEQQSDDALADLIAELCHDGIVEDPSQIAILAYTPSEATASGVGYLVRELESRGIPVYNPRGKDMAQTEEVMNLFGMISLVIDPDGKYPSFLHNNYDAKLILWIEEARNLAMTNASADKMSSDYLKAAHAAIAAASDKKSYSLVGEIMVHILNLPTFHAYPDIPVSAWRLAKGTNWIEQYTMIPGKKNTPAFQSVFVKDGEIAEYSLNKFYNLCCKSFFAGRTPEHEDEDEIVTPGHVSMMTIHQSKGLEFDVVVVRGLRRRNMQPVPAIMHTFFAPLRARPIPVHLDNDELRDTDDFRGYYVAFSRAKHLLILHDPLAWKGVPHERGHIGHDAINTRAYVNTNNNDSAVI